MRSAATLLLSAVLCACGPNTGNGGSDTDTTGTSSTGGQSCEALTQEAAQFLEDNGACAAAADCQYADKGCYAGPEVACVAVSHVADEAVAAEWSAILEGLAEACPSQCGGNECGASVDCVDGRCSAVFP